MRLPKRPRARARLQIRFREGLDLPSVRDNHSRLDSEAGEFNRVDLYLGRWNAPWFVIASWYETVDRRTGYRTWVEGGADWAVPELLSGLMLKRDWKIEPLTWGSGTFPTWFRSKGPKLFNVRRKSLEKVLQLAGLIPWSNRRIRPDRLMAGNICIDLLGKYRELRALNEGSLVVLTELFTGRSIALDAINPENRPEWDTAHNGVHTWLYLGP